MKRVLAIILAAMLLFALCGCGAKEDYITSDAEVAAAESYASDASSYAVGASDDGLTAQQNSGSGTVLDTDKIIYTCYAEVETQDFDGACQAVYALIDRVGGFLQSSSVNGQYYGSRGARSASFTIRIPRQSFDEVVGALSSLGNVPYCRTDAENITADYRDTESRLNTYLTEQERLFSMLEKAETVEEMLSIESRLSEVRYNIESLTSTLQNWDSLLSYSTLTLSVREVQVYTEIEEPSYWKSVENALTNTLEGIAEFFKNFLRFLIAALPVLAILAVAGGIVVLCVISAKKRRAKKRARLSSQEGPEGEE